MASGRSFGCKIPLSTVIRVQDTSGSAMRRYPAAAARAGFSSALLSEHKGQIKSAVAKTILSDHDDLNTKSSGNPGGRTICGHFDSDDGHLGGVHGPYLPVGLVGRKVTTAALLERNACSSPLGSRLRDPFTAKPFFKRHSQYRMDASMTQDRPRRAWAEFHRNKKRTGPAHAEGQSFTMEVTAMRVGSPA